MGQGTEVRRLTHSRPSVPVPVLPHSRRRCRFAASPHHRSSRSSLLLHSSVLSTQPAPLFSSPSPIAVTHDGQGWRRRRSPHSPKKVLERLQPRQPPARPTRRAPTTRPRRRRHSTPATRQPPAPPRRPPPPLLPLSFLSPLPLPLPPLPRPPLPRSRRRHCYSWHSARRCPPPARQGGAGRPAPRPLHPLLRRRQRPPPLVPAERRGTGDAGGTGGHRGQSRGEGGGRRGAQAQRGRPPLARARGHRPPVVRPARPHRRRRRGPRRPAGGDQGGEEADEGGGGGRASRRPPPASSLSAARFLLRPVAVSATASPPQPLPLR